MPESSEKDKQYDSWRNEESYFRQMLDCGDNYNHWVEFALSYLPKEILDEHKENLVFVSTAQKDGSRLARKHCENREIILLSERILPKLNARENHPEVRYFIYVVLHEVVHAIRKHKSPKFDNLTAEEDKVQEEEADKIALDWFNLYIKERNNPHLKPLTREEIKAEQEKNQELIKKLYEGN
jgi:prophage antirepressor-like protein